MQLFAHFVGSVHYEISKNNQNYNAVLVMSEMKQSAETWYTSTQPDIAPQKLRAFRPIEKIRWFD